MPRKQWITNTNLCYGQAAGNIDKGRIIPMKTHKMYKNEVIKGLLRLISVKKKHSVFHKEKQYKKSFSQTYLYATVVKINKYLIFILYSWFKLKNI